MIIKAYYWRQFQYIKNLGDLITEIIIEEKGYQFSPYRRPDNICHLMVGSLLGSGMLQDIPCKKIVWGSGYYGDTRFKIDAHTNTEYRAVRGPLSRRELNLPESLPIGDPALLLPRFKTFEKRNIGTSYVPHFSNKYRIFNHTIDNLKVKNFINTDIPKIEFWNSIEKIANSEFILTSSLHGAIIAHAYGVPWAAYMPHEVVTEEMLFGKWKDWFEYLNIAPYYPNNMADAEKWWNEHGSKGSIRDLDALDNAFPHPQN